MNVFGIWDLGEFLGENYQFMLVVSKPRCCDILKDLPCTHQQWLDILSTHELFGGCKPRWRLVSCFCMFEVTLNEAVYLPESTFTQGTNSPDIECPGLLDWACFFFWIRPHLSPAVFQEMEGMVAPNPMTADDLKVRITLNQIHQVGLGGLERSLGNNCGMSSWILGIF